MGKELHILNPEDIREDLIVFFKSESLIPIVGSGISCGVPTNKGSIPSGADYKRHMVQELLNNPQFTDEERAELEHEKFSTLCDYYEERARGNYIGVIIVEHSYVNLDGKASKG